MNCRRSTPSRAGSALVLTLIVVAMLTLGAAAFFERMFAEHQAERAHGRQLQANNLAESGVEYAKAVLMQDPTTTQQAGGLFSNPNLFQAVLVNDDPLAAFRGRFTILSPDLTTDGYFGGTRYGLESESGRLNLNTILLADQSGQNGGRTLLMTLPGMTEQIADAILDWLDPDDNPREQGAERDYYAALPHPYAPRNGPLASIDELLLIRGVTPALLYGADLNRNCAIDGNEQNLTTIDNADNSNGDLNRGWAAYLTLDSAEANVRSDGTPKIDVNMDDLNALQQQLSQVFTPDETNFIIAYRQGGAYTGSDAGAKDISSVQVDTKQKGSVRLNTVLDLIGAKTRIAKSGQGGSSGQSGGTGGGNRGADGGGNGGANGGGRGGGAAGSGAGRNGVALSGGNVATTSSGGSAASDNSRVVIKPAFPTDTASMQTYLPKLMENLAVNAAPSIPGRLNVNQAPRALLLGIPNITPTQVDQILSTRDVTGGQQHPEQMYETWLLQDSVVDLPTMKKLMPLVTAKGSVYRAQIVGFFDEEGPADRIEVVIDGTQTPPIVRRRTSLRHLGVGYTPEVLGVPVSDAAF
jgi:type II secretory pathway component PulK